MKKKPKENQYQKNIDDYEEHGPVQLGLMASHLWRTDPRHLSFTLARYKHVAKFLHGKKNALEIGCGDGFAAGIVQQEVSVVTVWTLITILLKVPKKLGKKTMPFIFLLKIF